MKNKSGRVTNNIFYNQNFYVSQFGGGGSFDVVGNYYRKGPMNSDFHEVQAFSSAASDALDGSPSLYLAGNLGWNQPDPFGDQWVMSRRVTGENGTESGEIPASWRRASPLPQTPLPITVEPVDRIKAVSGSILPTVGASRRLDCQGAWVANRDAVDSRLIAEYLAGDGLSSPFKNEQEAGGLPTITAGSACKDADKDGMPDLWEQEHGLSTSDPEDRNTKRAGAKGYTNLELYLSGLFPSGMPLPAP